MAKNHKEEAELEKFLVAPLAEEDQKLKRRGFIPLMVEGSGPNPIVGRVATYKGKTRISLRFHWWTGKLLSPTKRGIEIPLEDAAEVHKLLGAILEQVEKENQL